jgi:1-acyl-sn-glycerol-3-phosphate acyltransferase
LSRAVPDTKLHPAYQGPEYLAAVADGAHDPLVHGDPYRPTRLYRFAFGLMRLLLPRLFRFRVIGLENVPRPPFIIASNHQTWYDTLFIVAAFPRIPMIYTMARRDTVFNRSWKRRLIPKFGVFPIMPNPGVPAKSKISWGGNPGVPAKSKISWGGNLGELDQRGVATVYQVLARRGVVLIFPEGRYSRGRRLRPLKKGIAHFALQAGVPICPVALSGLDPLRPFARVEVSIGPPIWPDPPAWWSAARRVQRMVDRVRRAIQRAFGRGSEERRTWRSRMGSVPGRLLARLRHPLRRRSSLAVMAVDEPLHPRNLR